MAKTAKPLKTLKSDSGIANGLFDGLYSDDKLWKSYTKGYDADSIAQLDAIREMASKNPLGMEDLINTEGLKPQTGFKTTTGLLGNWIKQHPVKSAGIGLGAGMNIAGLFDNPYVIGQLGGAALGGFGGNLLAKGLTGNPLSKSNLILSTLGGGALGSLFDKLMAKKAEEQQYRGQY